MTEAGIFPFYEPNPDPDCIIARSNSILDNTNEGPSLAEVFSLSVDIFAHEKKVTCLKEQRLCVGLETMLRYYSDDLGGRLFIGYSDDGFVQTCDLQIVPNIGFMLPPIPGVVITRYPDGSYEHLLTDESGEPMEDYDVSREDPLPLNGARFYITKMRDALAQKILT